MHLCHFFVTAYLPDYVPEFPIIAVMNTVVIHAVSTHFNAGISPDSVLALTIFVLYFKSVLKSVESTVRQKIPAHEEPLHLQEVSSNTP